MKQHFVLFVLLTLCGSAFGAAIVLPSDPLFIDATTAAGSSFVFTGVLTGADTLAFSTSGTSCLQSGNTYCVNPAGVVVVAGSTGVGGTSANGGTAFGSLLLTISGVGTAQVFATNAANGLGSGAPASALTLSATALSAFFGAFTSGVNPTITFSVSDTLRSDNSGGFNLSQGSGRVPEPNSALLLVGGLAGIAFGFRKRRV